MTHYGSLCFGSSTESLNIFGSFHDLNQRLSLSMEYHLLMVVLLKQRIIPVSSSLEVFLAPSSRSVRCRLQLTRSGTWTLPTPDPIYLISILSPYSPGSSSPGSCCHSILLPHDPSYHPSRSISEYRGYGDVPLITRLLVRRPFVWSPALGLDPPSLRATKRDENLSWHKSLDSKIPYSSNSSWLCRLR